MSSNFSYVQIIFNELFFKKLFVCPIFYIGIVIAMLNMFIIVRSNKDKLSVGFLFLLLYTVLMLLPSVLILTYYQDSASVLSFFAIQIFPSLFTVGKLFVRNKNSDSIKNIMPSPTKADNLIISDYAFVFCMGVFLFCLCLFLFLTFLNNYKIPLYSLLSGYGYTGLVRMKIYDFPVLLQFFHAVIIRIFAPFVLTLVYYRLYIYDQRKFLYLFCFMFFSSFLFAIMTLERSQVLFISSSAVFLTLLFFNRPKSVLMLVCFLLLSFVGFAYVAVNVANQAYGYSIVGSDTASLITYSLRSFIYRVIIDPSFMTYLIFKKFPVFSEWLWFANNRLFSFLITVKQQGISSIGMVGDAWSGFHFFGIFFYPMVLNILILKVCGLLKERTDINLSCLVVFLTSLLLNIYSVMFPVMFLSAIFFVITIQFIVRVCQFFKPLQRLA